MIDYSCRVFSILSEMWIKLVFLQITSHSPSIPVLAFLEVCRPTSRRTFGGVKPSFARMANTNCLSRGPAREKNSELLQWVFLTVVE